MTKINEKSVVNKPIETKPKKVYKESKTKSLFDTLCESVLTKMSEKS